MATSAASHAARGPAMVLLSNATAQWVVLGVSVYFFSPDHVRDRFHRSMLGLLAAPDQQQQQSQLSNGNQNSSSPIVLSVLDPQYGSRGAGYQRSNHRSWLGMGVQVAVCVGGVWTTYVVVTQMLPENLSKFLPVTKIVLEQAKNHLAKSMLALRDVLGNEIKKLQGKQDELESLQRDTKQGVDELTDHLAQVRSNVHSMHATVERCEETLQASHATHAYTARGVKLLVTAVSSILNPDDRIAQELNHYLKAGDLVYNNNKNGPEDDRPQLKPSSRTNSFTVPRSLSSSGRPPVTTTAPEDGKKEELDAIVTGRWNNSSSRMVLSSGR